MKETRWERQRRLGPPEPNPFKMKRAANQRARFLNDREEKAWRGAYDRAGNPSD